MTPAWTNNEKMLMIGTWHPVNKGKLYFIPMNQSNGVLDFAGASMYSIDGQVVYIDQTVIGD